MDKRKEANEKVRNSICLALWDLMEEEAFENISTTSIIERAQVARASFYRNFTSKEEVLAALIRAGIGDFDKEVKRRGITYYSEAFTKLAYEFIRHHRTRILCMDQAGKISYLLQEMNAYHNRISDVVKNSAVNAYAVYGYVGALMNTALLWLTRKEPESAAQLAHEFYVWTTGKERFDSEDATVVSGLEA